MKNYAPKGKFLWDSWFIKEDNKYHLFHLQSDPTKNPKDRHDNNVSIGHAVSEDLKNWHTLAVALEPGKNDEWDNLSLWTGSVIKKDGQYYMFYTGRQKNAEKKYIQKIGLAISSDLNNWQKYKANPLLEAASRYYDMSNQRNDLGKISAWRDPYVFWDNKKQKYYMLIAARQKSDKKEFNACIAIAESNNLTDWNILPPLLMPGIYDQMEVPQMIIHDNIYYLFFSAHITDYNSEMGIRSGPAGERNCFYATELFGKYKPVNQNSMIYNKNRQIYDLHIVEKINNNIFNAVGWLNENEQGRFIGKLSQTIKIKIEKNKINIL